jgi:PilZ domain
MHSERLRATRHSFMALIDLTNIHSDSHLGALTRDLSLSGCSVKTGTPFPKGATVRLRIWHAGMNFFAEGKVAYSRTDLGMGIAFTAIEASGMPILDSWLAHLRN